MRNADEPDDEIPAGDSFLDVIANMVGILVLLVVIVGVRAGRQVFTATPAPPSEAQPLESLRARIDEEARRARAGREEVLEARERALAAAAEADRRNALRESAALYVMKLRSELDAARRDLTEGDRRSLETHNALAQAQLKLDRLAREQVALANQEPEPDVETVEVAPTPIVDGKADQTISFRLQGDRLVYVPINELEVELAKKIDVPALTDPSRGVVTRETVGPVEGFVGEAEIGWTLRSSGARVAIRPQLGKLVLHEVTPLRGESPDEAFAPGGYVGSRVELLDPAKFVIRLIVYADSFETSPEVARQFRERGFRVAQSLKSNGQPIGFSSDGFKAVTQ